MFFVGKQVDTIWICMCIIFNTIFRRLPSPLATPLCDVVYRPGSAALTATFLSELADTLGRFRRASNHLCSLATSISGSSAAPIRTQSSSMICWQDVTHNQGGIFDVVWTRGGLPSPTVVVCDGGFSDHHLLRWVSPLQRLLPVYTAAHRRLCGSFFLDTFIADLQTPVLCDERPYEHLDALSKLYDDTVTGLLDKQIPSSSSHVSSKIVHHVVRRRVS